MYILHRVATFLYVYTGQSIGQCAHKMQQLRDEQSTFYKSCTNAKCNYTTNSVLHHVLHYTEHIHAAMWLQFYKIFYIQTCFINKREFWRKIQLVILNWTIAIMITSLFVFRWKIFLGWNETLGVMFNHLYFLFRS